MRISDWSSDVCSSDLAAASQDTDAAKLVVAVVELQRKTTQRISRGQCRIDGRVAAVAQARSEERRVGKDVSVRVDLGGRRIIKKKTKNVTTTDTRKTTLSRYNTNEQQNKYNLI